MGHYTEFVLNVKLQSDMPAQAIDMLLFLSDQGTEPTVLPDHPFFSSTQWRDILIGLPPCGSMPHTSPVFKRDEDNGDEDAPYWLSVRSEFRNADQEIKKFMDWLLPLLDAMDGDFLGYQKRDYGTDEVTLYYFKETEPFQPDTARYLETIKIEEDYHIVKQRAVVTAETPLLQAPDHLDLAIVQSSTQEAGPSDASPSKHPQKQRDDAQRLASEGIQQLLNAGISYAYVAEAYAAAGLNLLMEHHSYESARDLLTALWMKLEQQEENARHDHTRI